MDERLSKVVIVDKEVHNLLPGEITHSKLHKAWVVGCPGDCLGGRGANNLANHDVTYDEQLGEITVSPSILCGCGAHYFIEQNKIRWV